MTERIELTTADLQFALYHLRVVAIGWENNHAWCLMNTPGETADYMRLRAQQAWEVVSNFERELSSRGIDISHVAIDNAIKLPKGVLQ